MKRLSVSLLSLIALGTTIVSCTNPKDENKTAAETAIEVTVLDDNGQPVKNANITLLDYSDTSNPTKVENGTGTTDVNGKFLFSKGLKSINYVAVAEGNGSDSGCKYGYSITDAVIKLNQKTALSVSAHSEGYVTFNNSANNYLLLGKTSKGYVNLLGGTTLLEKGKGANNPIALGIGTTTYKAVKINDDGKMYDNSGAEITTQDQFNAYVNQLPEQTTSVSSECAESSVNLD